MIVNITLLVLTTTKVVPAWKNVTVLSNAFKILVPNSRTKKETRNIRRYDCLVIRD